MNGPRDAVEQKLVAIMGEVLGFQSIGVGEDFFDLGGDSLQSLELLALIERRMGVRIPFHVLADGPTAAHLAKVVQNEFSADEWSPLVRLRRGSSRAPLFLAAPAGGNVLCYRPLVECMGCNRPVYGLQAPGLDGTRQPLTSVGEFAACYLEEIRRVQPAGPYYLGGWSFGAFVVYEMAVRLERQGERVAVLAVIDSAIRYTFRMVDSVLTSDGLGIRGILSKPLDEQVDIFRARTRPAQLVPAAASRELSRRIYEVCIQNIRAALEFRPAAYRGTLTLLEAEEKLARPRQTAEDEWRPLCCNIERHVVPGNHFTIMSSPHVQAVAATLRMCLDRAESATAGGTPATDNTSLG